MTRSTRIRMPLLGFAIAALTVMGMGAVSGSAIGNSPMLASDDEVLPIASGGVQASQQAAFRNGQRPPDHYPLVTPEGTIPVAELALHGRLRDQQLQWEEYGERAELSADYQMEFDEADIDRLAHGPAVQPRPQEYVEEQAPPPDAGGLVHNGSLEVEPLPQRPAVITIQ